MADFDILTKNIKQQIVECSRSKYYNKTQRLKVLQNALHMTEIKRAEYEKLPDILKNQQYLQLYMKPAQKNLDLYVKLPKSQTDLSLYDIEREALNLDEDVVPVAAAFYVAPEIIAELNSSKTLENNGNPAETKGIIAQISTFLGMNPSKSATSINLENKLSETSETSEVGTSEAEVKFGEIKNVESDKNTTLALSDENVKKHKKVRFAEDTNSTKELEKSEQNLVSILVLCGDDETIKNKKAQNELSFIDNINDAEFYYLNIAKSKSLSNGDKNCNSGLSNINNCNFPKMDYIYNEYCMMTTLFEKNVIENIIHLLKDKGKFVFLRYNDKFPNILVSMTTNTHIRSIDELKEYMPKNVEINIVERGAYKYIEISKIDNKLGGSKNIIIEQNNNELKINANEANPITIYRYRENVVPRKFEDQPYNNTYDLHKWPQNGDLIQVAFSDSKEFASNIIQWKSKKSNKSSDLLSETRNGILPNIKNSCYFHSVIQLLRTLYRYGGLKITNKNVLTEYIQNWNVDQTSKSYESAFNLIKNLYSINWNYGEIGGPEEILCIILNYPKETGIKTLLTCTKNLSIFGSKGSEYNNNFVLTYDLNLENSNYEPISIIYAANDTGGHFWTISKHGDKFYKYDDVGVEKVSKVSKFETDNAKLVLYKNKNISGGNSQLSDNPQLTAHIKFILGL